MRTFSLRLTQAEEQLVASARRAVLATIAADGRPRVVPIAYALDLAAGVLYSALDEKPKSVSDPRQLARVRDVLARPAVSVLVDRWSEEWAELGWLRLDGEASLLEPTGDDPADDAATEHAKALRLLRERYPQYADQQLERRPVLKVVVSSATSWAATR